MAYEQGPFDRNHLLLVWGGLLPGNETWSCSVKLADAHAGITGVMNDAYLSLVDTQDAVDGYIKDAVYNYHTRSSTHIHESARLTYCKLNLINRDGHYDAESTSEHVFTTTGGGGGSTNLHPNQVALVVSLTTNVTRGPAHRGRFYLPMPALAVDQTSGLVDSSFITQVNTSTKQFLEDISDVPGIDLAGSPGAVIMSRKLGHPQTRQVFGVDCGRVLDTQRRRRRSLPESYIHAVVDQGVA